ncbi:hypothetical protein L1987_30530 [Smallanthus sonchifolius]|uniref:Uncharacterized protein n=1 Tax=Smallanthus sonchifolius TaxID=185202 RepID=A0ACB9I494_9ASTR|nr:hypothetical protein L1987_30530 [Smallanthus sonchifolius]
MDSVNVEMISDCFVKPKFLSEEAKKPIHLSPWDLMMTTINYISRGLLFPLPKNQDFSITTFLEDLKDSLSATLTHFHPLAARLSTVKQQNTSSLVIFLNPENSPGARFIHSSVNLTVADILTPTDIPEIVESFFDHYKAINHDGHELSLLSVQVTELTDGIFIGCSINHMVVDGTSYWHFFNSWSEMFNSKNRDSISRPPVLDRWFPSGSGPIIAFPFTNEDQIIERPNHPVFRERIFRFSSHSLSKLKAKVNSECNATKIISTFQSLSALVWRCMTRARRLSAGEQTTCGLAVNNRSRLSPPVPENYFGNMAYGVWGRATAGELLDHGVGWGALQLHKAVVNNGDKELKEMINSWVKNPSVTKLGELFDRNRNHVQMVSSPRFDMYGNEFGLGKALAVFFGYSYKFDGKVAVIPGRDGGGSMDVKVCLLPENMMAFESDEEFMSFVNEGCIN